MYHDRVDPGLVASDSIWTVFNHIFALLAEEKFEIIGLLFDLDILGHNLGDLVHLLYEDLAEELLDYVAGELQEDYVEVGGLVVAELDE